MYKSLRTKKHLTICSANYTRLRKILCDFRNDAYTFEILNHGQKNQAEFLVISRTPHTLSIEAKFKNNNVQNLKTNISNKKIKHSVNGNTNTVYINPMNSLLFVLFSPIIYSKLQNN